MKRRYKNLIEVWYDPNDNNKIVRSAMVRAIRLTDYKYGNLNYISHAHRHWTEDNKDNTKLAVTHTEFLRIIGMDKSSNK